MLTQISRPPPKATFETHQIAAGASGMGPTAIVASLAKTLEATDGRQAGRPAGRRASGPAGWWAGGRASGRAVGLAGLAASRPAGILQSIGAEANGAGVPGVVRVA